MDYLRIAQVSPLYESVPPKLYGGTERVVSHLTEKLVELGHDVTLFASGDSVTKARLMPACKNALRLNRECIDQLASHIAMIQMVLNEMDNFDVIHYHIDYLHYPVSKLFPFPHFTTLHGRLNICDVQDMYNLFDDMPVTSISNAQRKPLPHLNWVGNVYHGLPRDLFRPNYNEGKYLAFLGRISPEKRVDRAIDIALKTGLPLKIAAKVDKQDEVYFEKHIRKLLDHPLIEFLGEINENEKQDFLGQAMALLFPIDWHEPFGLVMIESMACGTPVIAYEHGSVPEIIDHGKSGFIVHNQEQAVAAVLNIQKLSRQACRAQFDLRFTSDRMAKDYLSLYRKMIALHDPSKKLKLVAP